MIASRDLDQVPYDAQRINTWLHTSVSCSYLRPDSVLPLLLHRTEHVLTSKKQEKWKYQWSWQLSGTPHTPLTNAIAESSWPDTKPDTGAQSTNLSTWHLIPPCVDQYWNCEWGNGAKGHSAALKQPRRGRVKLVGKKKRRRAVRSRQRGKCSAAKGLATFASSLLIVSRRRMSAGMHSMASHCLV